MNKSWSEEEDRILKESLQRVDNVKEICELLTGRTIHAIHCRCNKLHLKKENKYNKNETFFEIPNPLNSNVAGFIASDGHLRKKLRKNGNFSYAINITLSNKDKLFLIDIAKLTNSTSKINDFSRHSPNPSFINGRQIKQDGIFSGLHFYAAEKWVKDLNKNWNIPIGHKSLTLPAPDIDDLEIGLAYFCGLVNGDGSVSVKKSGKYKDLYISLTGTKELLYWCRELLGKFLKKKINSKPYSRKYNKAYYFNISGFNAARIVEKINSMNIPILERKWKHPNVLAQIDYYKNRYPQKFSNSISQKPPQSVIGAN